MKLLIITQYFPPEKGAAPTRLAAMVNHLRKIGYDIEVVTSMPNYPDARIFPDYRGRFYMCEHLFDSTVHRFWLFAAQGRGLARLFNYLSFALVACFGIFKIRRPDLIFVNSGPLFVVLPGYLASKVWRAPYIFNVADLWPESIVSITSPRNAIFIKVLEAVENFAYRKAALVTGVTQGIIEVLKVKKLVPTEKICFLPNGVDTELFKPRPPSQKIIDRHGLSGKWVMIYPGTHGYLHALENVLKTAEMLRNRTDIAFLFVGGGSEKPSLKALAKELNLQNVIFVDSVGQEELAEYISVANCGLIHQRNTPLANETRPAKALPMLAMAKPLIYAGFGEGAEMIKKAQAGIVITPENPTLLKATILEAIEMGSNFSSMGENGRDLAISTFSWETLIEDWRLDVENKIKPSKDKS